MTHYPPHSEVTGAPHKREDEKNLTKARSTCQTGRPIRVCMIHYRDDAAFGGGSLRVGETLARYLDPKRVEVHLVFAYGEPGPVAKSARVPCHFLRANGPTDLRAWLRARKLIAALRPAILHYHDAVVWLHAALAAVGVFRIIHIHSYYVPARARWYDRLIWSAMAPTADRLVCITRGVAESMMRIRGVTREKTTVVYNAIDCSRFDERASREEARRALRLPVERSLIGMACRIVWSKGCADALRLLEFLSETWNLVFVGDGPDRKALESLVRTKGLGERVIFAGACEKMPMAYAAIDGFLFLSHIEAFGLVLAEAMAAGVPVFGLAVGGQLREPEYPLITSENSFLYERTRDVTTDSGEASESDLREVARRIEAYGRSPADYNETISNARNWVRSRFDGPVQAEAMARVYESVAGR